MRIELLLICFMVCIDPGAPGNVYTMSAQCSTPSAEDIMLMAKTIHGEAGICSETQKRAVGWVICNRVDCEDFPDTVAEVITQPHQFKGYAADKEPTDEEIRIAREILTDWMNGNEDNRTIPRRFLFFHSDHKGNNIFTTNHLKGEVWKY